MPRCDRATPRPSTVTRPADSWPRCCRLYSPRYATCAASGTPVTPMMPHIRCSVSHATGDAREIYLAQPSDGVLDVCVPQPQPHGAAPVRHHADAQRGHTELLSERGDRRGALRCAGDHGATVGFTE